MNPSAETNPTAFVSWAHRDPDWGDDDARAWEREVYAFAYLLRGYSIDLDLDLFHQSEPGVDWTRFGPKRIGESQWVIVVLSRAWRERWEGVNVPTVGAGAVAEADALRSIFTRDQQAFRNKVVLVTLPPRRNENDVPLGLDGVHRFALADYSHEQLVPLLRLLTSQPAFPAGPLGQLPQLPPVVEAPITPDIELLPNHAAGEPRPWTDEIDQRIGAVKQALSQLSESLNEPDAQRRGAREHLAEQLTELEHERASLTPAAPEAGAELPSKSQSARLRDRHPELSAALESALQRAEVRALAANLADAREMLAGHILGDADNIQSALSVELAALAKAEEQLEAARQAAIEAFTDQRRPRARQRYREILEQSDRLEAEINQRTGDLMTERGGLNDYRLTTELHKSQLAARLADDPSSEAPHRPRIWQRLTPRQHETVRLRTEIEEREFEHQRRMEGLRGTDKALQDMVTMSKRYLLELTRLKGDLIRLDTEARQLQHADSAAYPDVTSAGAHVAAARRDLHDVTVDRELLPRCCAWLRSQSS